jgi:hypothetical protein
MSTNAIVPLTPELPDVGIPRAAMPSIAEIQHRMTWMKEFRQVLIDYVREHMDPTRHMYRFDASGYQLIRTSDEITQMLAKGQKPALNQDGIHNLMALYECDPISQDLVETVDDEGHCEIRVTLRLRYFGTRHVLGVGVCSTRESKYAYRWVNGNQVPSGVDKMALRTRTFTPAGRQAYTRYRLDNEDLADIKNTIVNMAIKRAKSSAVKMLPGVSEMFAQVGDPDEGHREDDLARQEVLNVLSDWLDTLKSQATQARALFAVFGKPVAVKDVPKQELDTLLHAEHVIRVAAKAGIVWTSPKLADELKAALAASARRSQADLYGDEAVDRDTGEVRPSTAQNGPQATATGEIVPPDKPPETRGGTRGIRVGRPGLAPIQAATATEAEAPPQGESPPPPQMSTEDLFALEERQAREAAEKGE